MKNTKYKLTDEKKDLFGRTLYRIEALKSFGNVSKGDKGGWVETEANLSFSGDAWVFGNAEVFGDARVSGNAEVFGDAWVSGNAEVFGDAWVSGNARVFGDAQVFGDARVSGNAQVSGNAWVSGNAQVSGNARVSGNAQVSGNAWVSGNAQVSGNARVSGKLKLKAGLFFGVRWSHDTEIKEIEIENGDYLVYKGEAEFGNDEPELSDGELIAELERRGKIEQGKIIG